MLAFFTIVVANTATAGPCDKMPDDFFLLDAVPQARDVGIDYSHELTQAFQKDPEALEKLFTVSGSLDGSGAQTHAGILYALLECWGDSAFAAALKREPTTICSRVLEYLHYDTAESGGYESTYPATSALRNACL